MRDPQYYKDKKMLVVVAHPDDETFGMGGTLALYAQLGVEVHLICATRGEVGEVPQENLIGFNSIGELREHELCCAANLMGLKKVHFLNYRDSGMPGSKENHHPNAFIQAPIKDVAEQIAEYIRQVKPDVMITFDPIGGYLHPDHIVAHQAAVKAFGMAADRNWKGASLTAHQVEKLYFHTIPKRFLRIVVALMPLFGKDPAAFGKNHDINLKAVLAENYPIHAKINYHAVSKLREQASACHASQGGDQQSGYIVSWIIRLVNSVESFMRAYPAVETRKIEKDLFVGIPS